MGVWVGSWYRAFCRVDANLQRNIRLFLDVVKWVRKVKCL